MSMPHSVKKATGRVLGCVLAAAMQLDAGAAEQSVPDYIREELPQAHLAGQGSFHWFGLKIYDARLWVGPKGYAANPVPTEKFILELRYARSFQGVKIAEASKEQMQNLGIGSAAQHRTWQEKMEQIFPDVKEGTRLTGMYLPGQGARFYLDGKPSGDILDPEFAQAFFAIWLHPRTAADALRTALLADAGPRR